MSACKECGNSPKRSFYIYCSNKCQIRYQYRKYIEEWKKGAVIKTKNVSAYLKRYLIENHGEKCSLCEWKKKHPITGKVPIEVDHIDGNSNNNSEKNLRLLCPNCHSLTVNFRNLNRGKGREWRSRYIKRRRSSVGRAIAL